MNIEEIMFVLEELAHYDGYYERVYREYCEIKKGDAEWFEYIKKDLERKHFNCRDDVMKYFDPCYRRTSMTNF